ncbi:transposable element Tcb1 transposase [Trichonephila clavipes]|nr:transposable element Tcb1 transposase [Trichonephila clavipes]
METITNHRGSCPKARRWSPKGYKTAEDRYIAIVAKRNRRATCTRVASIVTASIAVGLTFVLMDDNARPHRADIVDDYLESEGIARMACPGYSPDLNPIENPWDALGRAVP